MSQQRITTILRAFLTTTFVVVISALWAFAGPTGQITGHVVDRESGAPLPNATVRLVDPQRTVLSDSSGGFTIDNLPDGVYSVCCEYVGYASSTNDSLSVADGDMVDIRVILVAVPIAGTDITVISEYFPKTERVTGSTIDLTAEELRRSPKNLGDVARAMTTLPAVTQLIDLYNGIVVRGGSPVENGYYLDNMEVPDINHLSSQGSTGGAISVISMNLVDGMEIQAGGFDASYGDKLSSITHLTMREGRSDRIHAGIDFSAAGATAIVESPLPNSGSMLLGARRSYLDDLLETVDVKTVPRFRDGFGKLSLPISPIHTVTLLGMVGRGDYLLEYDPPTEDWFAYFGDWYQLSHMVGADWRANWSPRLTSRTSLSRHVSTYDYRYYSRRDRANLFNNKSDDATIALRNVNHWRLNDRRRLDFGAELKHLINHNDFDYAEMLTPIGFPVPAWVCKTREISLKPAVFATYGADFTSRLSATAGLRLDYFTLTERAHLNPRFSVRYRLASPTVLHAAAGIVHQSLPLNLMAQQERHRSLDDPVAYHVLVGIRQNIGAATRLTLEAYRKWYRNMPMDPLQGSLFLFDETQYQDAMYFLYHEFILDRGRALSAGLELSVQRRKSEGIYGLVSLSLSRARYKSLDGKWHDRIIDTRYTATVDGGVDLGKNLGMSLSWNLVGGLPYTPYDEEYSEWAGQGVIDFNQVNTRRLDATHALDIRIDRRFRIGPTHLATYIGIWNAYNQRNVSRVLWNPDYKALFQTYRLGRTVILGLEFGF